MDKTIEPLWNTQLDTEIRMAKIDRRLGTITELLHEGMKMVAHAHCACASSEPGHRIALEKAQADFEALPPENSRTQ